MTKVASATGQSLKMIVEVTGVAVVVPFSVVEVVPDWTAQWSSPTGSSARTGGAGTKEEGGKGKREGREVGEGLAIVCSPWCLPSPVATKVVLKGPTRAADQL